MRSLRYLISNLAFASCALAQTPFVAPSEAAIDPDQIYSRILSGSDAERQAAYAAMGFPLGSDGKPFGTDGAPLDVRLLAVNLDEDPALERVLIARTLFVQSVAIFDLPNAHWMLVGTFLCCGVNAPSDREPFLELKQTVRHGVNDVVVHGGGSAGPGIARWSLSVFRLRDGRLYQVFDSVETAHSLTNEEHATFRYPDLGQSSAPPRIQVQREKRTGQRKTISCAIHSWNTKQFAFVAGPANPGPCPQ